MKPFVVCNSLVGLHTTDIPTSHSRQPNYNDMSPHFQMPRKPLIFTPARCLTTWGVNQTIYCNHATHKAICLHHWFPRAMLEYHKSNCLLTCSDPKIPRWVRFPGYLNWIHTLSCTETSRHRGEWDSQGKWMGSTVSGTAPTHKRAYSLLLRTHQANIIRSEHRLLPTYR